ncbi:MAG: UDPGP type 1 family protein, partial [Kiritimatiellae bacterium]|nr:UDPGP type 1 family protein [Kiritimatiellia bacterium]
VAAGEKELKAGRVAALLVAGGQGSRLGYDGPKGCYPIGPVTLAPLFYFHARKILARSLRYGAPIPFYVMTSEANNEVTVRCFEENDYFGLDPHDVFFFTQGMWPGMTADGRIILDAPGHVFMSPDGHGGLLAALKRSGALDDMKRRGVESVFFFQVDNPLVEVADPAFIGFHVSNESEYSLKLCAKRDPYEKVGMPMQFGAQYRMVEYTEMTKDQCERRAKDGSLYFLYGSPAIHVFDRAFLAREAGKDMPLHLAFKKIPSVGADGKVVKPSEPNGYKFEKFIFDILPNARRAAFLAFDPKDEFAPVKNAEGADSPATCKAALQAKWRRALAEAGVDVKEGVPVEIDPAYALDAADLKALGLSLSAQ